MIQAGILVENILQVSHGLNDKAMKERVWRYLNQEYLAICQRVSIQGLRLDIDISFSSVGTTGVYLPSDLLGIDRVRDNTNDIEFIPRNESGIQPDEDSYRYYRYKPESSALLRDDDVIIDKKAATFTSVSTSALVAAGTDVTDEYVRLGSEFGMYKITNNVSPFAIEPTYYGPDLTEGDIRIRPKETEKLVIVNKSQTPLQDRTVTVYYWKMPQPLYDNSDIIELPITEVLELRVLRRMPEAKPFHPVSENEIKDAMADLKRENPDFPRFQSPRDKQARLFAFNTNPFTDR